MQLTQKAWKKIEYAVSGVLLVLLAGLMLYLTYQQAWYAINGLTDEAYHSDILAYMKEVQGIDSGYSFPYPIMFWLMRLLHLVMPITWAVAIVITILQCLSFVLLRYYFKKYLGMGVVQSKGSGGQGMDRQNGWCQVLTTLAAFGVLFCSMIFVYNHPFPGTRFYYMGVFSPNPFHNATYIAARPFAIIAVFLFADLLDEYEKRPDMKKALAFSAILLLATMTKPSFTIVFCGAAGLIMLYRLFRSKCSNFKNTVLMGCMFIPTFVDLLYQFGGVFMGTDSKGQEAGIGFELFRVWREYCSNYLVAIILLIFFPLIGLVFQYRKLRTHTIYRFGWQMYGMSLAMFILLYEKGFRAVDANFSWGYMIGAFFLIMASLLVLLEDTFKAKAHSLKLLVQWGAFGLQVACGIFYFGMILLGYSYY